jgi:hypothetical protein
MLDGLSVFLAKQEPAPFVFIYKNRGVVNVEESNRLAVIHFWLGRNKRITSHAWFPHAYWSRNNLLRRTYLVRLEVSP